MQSEIKALTGQGDARIGFLRTARNEPVIFLVLRHAFYRERPYQPEQSGSPIQSSVTANRVFKSHKTQAQYKRAFSFSQPKLPTLLLQIESDESDSAT